MEKTLEKHNEQEHGYFHVDVVWKDGKPTTRNFPKAGFPVFKTNENGEATDERLGFVKGKDAVKFLQKHAHEYTSEEFSWKYYFESPDYDPLAGKVVTETEPSIIKIAKKLKQDKPGDNE